MTDLSIVSRPAYTYRAKFVGNYDGDTITVDIDLGLYTWIHEQKLRLYGIDTPEIRGDERERGLIARDYVYNRLHKANEITVETIKDRTGKYGRWLAIVWVDGENLNEELLIKGYAEPYV